QVGIVLQTDDGGDAVHVAQPQDVGDVRVLADDELRQDGVEPGWARSDGPATDAVPIEPGRIAHGAGQLERATSVHGVFAATSHGPGSAAPGLPHDAATASPLWL